MFTDVEASTALWVAHGDGFRGALERHDALMRENIARFGGYEVKAMGDAFMVAFSSAEDALAFCVAAVEALAVEPWGAVGPIRARVGLHVGEPLCIVTPNTGRLDYLGPVAIKASRLHVAAHGGQILISEEARRALARPPELLDLGAYALRGLDGEHRIWQVGQGAFPRLRAAALRRSNLPDPVDRFIGRADEIEALLALLRDGERLITLTGIGGTGKTRLATQVAHQALATLVDSAWLIDLSDARDEDDLHRATALALGLPLGPDPEAQLGHAIDGHGRVLLLFDNFEAVAEHGGVLSRWLSRAPDAAMLVTSQVPLRSRGERVVPLDPLPERDGVALFRERAHLAPGEHDEALAELAAALDGLPLAIELAAARAAALEPAQILARLRDRFRLLVSRGGDRPGRHATLRAALDWSWELLAPAEQRALARLSVFEGGFTLDAAEAVMEALTAHDPLDLLSELVDHSLLRRTGARFSFLSAVSEYARERIGADRADAEAAHARWFARFGDAVELEALRAHGGVERAAILRLEHDNIVAAARRGPSQHAAPAALAAWERFELHGPFKDGERLLATVLDRPDLCALDRARLQERSAEALRLMGRSVEARPLLEGVIETFTALGETAAAGRAECRMGRVCRDLGAVEQARERCERALATARATRDPLGEANALGELGLLDRNAGRPAEARASYEAAKALYRMLGDQRGEAVLLGGLGNLEWEQGNGAAARQCYEAALAVHRAFENRRGEATLLQNLGVIHRAMAQPDRARAFYASALSLHREIGNRRSEGIVLGNLANWMSEADPDEARIAYETALSIHREVGNRKSEVIDLGNLGAMHLSQGRLPEARAALTEALQGASQIKLPQAEGAFLGRFALLLLAEGDPAAALEATARGERALRAFNDPVELGRLLVARARAAIALGDPGLAEAALAEAEGLGRGCESVELLAELAAARRLPASF